jgi:hypothetical protein
MSLNSRIIRFVEKSALDNGLADFKLDLFRYNNFQSALSLQHDSEFVQIHTCGTQIVPTLFTVDNSAP